MHIMLLKDEINTFLEASPVDSKRTNQMLTEFNQDLDGACQRGMFELLRHNWLRIAVVMDEKQTGRVHPQRGDPLSKAMWPVWRQSRYVDQLVELRNTHASLHDLYFYQDTYHKYWRN